MNRNLLTIELQGQTIIGNVNFSTPFAVEVKIFSPYKGLVLSKINKGEDWNAEQQYKIAEQLLEDCYRYSTDLMRHRDLARMEFVKMLGILDKFNSQNRYDYMRNREQLMRVYAKSQLPHYKPEEDVDGRTALEIFNFMATWIVVNGKFPDFNIHSRPKDRVPPKFSQLEEKLRNYNSKSTEEKLQLQFREIATEKATEFAWFLEQEFGRGSLPGEFIERRKRNELKNDA